jgi:hypothetical protein
MTDSMYQNQSAARSLIHSAVGCDPVTDECDRIRMLLDQVEDDRVHAEAERIRTAVAEDAAYRPKGHAAMLEVAESMDPYEMRDGNLVRKSDGKIIKYKEQQS